MGYGGRQTEPLYSKGFPSRPFKDGVGLLNQGLDRRFRKTQKITFLLVYPFRGTERRPGYQVLLLKKIKRDLVGGGDGVDVSVSCRLLFSSRPYLLSRLDV